MTPSPDPPTPSSVPIVFETNLERSYVYNSATLNGETKVFTSGNASTTGYTGMSGTVVPGSTVVAVVTYVAAHAPTGIQIKVNGVVDSNAQIARSTTGTDTNITVTFTAPTGVDSILAQMVSSSKNVDEDDEDDSRVIEH